MNTRETAADIQKRAADWVFERHDAESWTAEDQSRLDAWLNEAIAHRVAYVRLETALQRSGRLAALRNGARKISEPASPAPRRRPYLFAAAALLAVAAIAGTGAAILSRDTQTQTFATTLGAHKTIVLADGTRIDLNTDTSLRAKIGAHQRLIWLEKGEAFFEVKHDAARPFVVTAGDYRVRDLGTRFSVRNDANHLEVALVEGRARFEAANDRVRMRETDLTPGDVVVATAEKVTISRKTESKLANELAWRRGLLVFNYTTLADAASEFNRYNTKKIVVSGAAAARLTVMGKFPATNVDLFGKVAKAVLGVRVEDRGNEIVVTKPGEEK
ncbi:MAG TPA: FecR domain-containing protein [Rhizomicrobium sp.]|nr:FecR domain-containing protein [Rhizomicrobium sp.]